jgi:colicin import membrane protein
MVGGMTESTPSPAGPAAAEPEAVCGYPGCERLPTAPTSKRGARPKYCDLKNEAGKAAHTALTAFREKDRLRKEAAGDDTDQAEPDDLGRPVTMSVARAAELREGIRRDVRGLADRLSLFEELLERIADPTAAEAQIDTITSEAAEQVAAAQADVAREVQRRQRAESAATQAEEAALEVDEQLTAAEAARAGAEERAAAARADTERVIAESEAQIDQARAEAAQRVAAAAEQVAAAEQDRDQQVAAARAEAATLVEQAQAQADEQVTAAAAERDQALRTAREETDRAATAVARAEASVARAQQAETDARAEVQRIREEMRERLAEQRGTYEERLAELTLARDEGLDRARRAETDLAAAATERQTLTDRIEQLHEQVTRLTGDLAAARATTSSTDPDPDIAD